MAAPFFATTSLLLADLKLLGYPSCSSPDSVSSNGPARLSTLRWLAHQIQPAYAPPSTEEELAAFWDYHGVHVFPKNNAGHRVPLTGSPDKPRDRQAAAQFMRAAIDLTIAVRRRRERNETQVGCGDEEKLNEMSEEDIQNANLLRQLIDRREELFPSSVGIFGRGEPKKRRALAVRRGNNGTEKKRIPKPKTATNRLKTREELIQRLREIQTEVADTKVDGENGNSGALREEIYIEEEWKEQDLQKIATDAKRLVDLLTQFEKEASELLEEREKRTDIVVKDAEEFQRVNGAAQDCEELRKELDAVVKKMTRLKIAADKLPSRQASLHTIMNTTEMVDVVQACERIKNYL